MKSMSLFALQSSQDATKHQGGELAFKSEGCYLDSGKDSDDQKPKCKQNKSVQSSVVTFTSKRNLPHSRPLARNYQRGRSVTTPKIKVEILGTDEDSDDQEPVCKQRKNNDTSSKSFFSSTHVNAKTLKQIKEEKHHESFNDNNLTSSYTSTNIFRSQVPQKNAEENLSRPDQKTHYHLRKTSIQPDTKKRKEPTQLQKLDLDETPAAISYANAGQYEGSLSSLSSTDNPEKQNIISKEQCFEQADVLWRKCMDSKDSANSYINALLERDKFPSSQMLNELVQHFGIKSDQVSMICDSICRNIKPLSECIIDVWAGFTPKNEDSVVFVIIANKDVKLCIKYKHEIKCIDKVSSEGRGVIYNDNFDTALLEMSSEEKKQMKYSINSVNVELMKKHKYLMMISGSPVRSRRYGTSFHELQKETCIVLYVLVKGYIPIQEKPFKQSYKGLSVDVREGLFKLFAGRAMDYHEHVTHSCQIYRHQLGTLGGFLDHYKYGLCGITCGHVLLGPNEMKNLHPNAMETEQSDQSRSVWQPDSADEGRNYLGKLVKAVYKEGGEGESGVDVAMFQIERRCPEVGDFPLCRDYRPSSLFYDSGKILKSNTTDEEVDVHKFGAATDYTFGKGILDLAISSVRTFEFNREYEIVLHNLLEIKTSDINGGPFAAEGDSGALIFSRNRDDELYCVGMVEGGTEHGTCVVVPVDAILKVIGVEKFKSFKGNKLLRLENKVDALEKTMLQNFQAIMQRLDGLGNRNFSQ